MFGAPITVTPPAGELIALDRAKSFLRVDGTELDVEIGMVAAAAVQDLEDMTGLRLLNQRVSVTADGFADLARFQVGPIRAIASIAYRDPAGTEQLLAAERYALAGAALEQGATPVGGPWPATRAEPRAITVTLDVGYGAAEADVPAKLKFAAFALMRAKYEQEAVDVGPLIANHRFWL